MPCTYRLPVGDMRAHSFRISSLSRATRFLHTQTRKIKAPSSLPPTFLSLYRLFLRATSASVLSHREATSRLRQIWRPVFDHAACAIYKIENNSLSADQRVVVMEWYRHWENRMDNTALLLYSSATSRGLPHRITHNLQQMALVNTAVRDPLLPNKRPWRGNLPPSSSEYRRKPKKPPTPTQTESHALFRATPRLLGEIVGMAESWGGLSLGRSCRRR